MKWDYESLWSKAKLYMLRSLEEDRSGTLYPFWSILGFEFLSRASVAKVHPALLADPQSGENLLYAFGIGQPKRPRSIPIKTVLSRCMAIVPDFLEQDLKTAMALMEMRNEELHTGEIPFQQLPSKIWLPDFYRLCELMLESQEKTLVDLFGEDEAKAAQEIIQTTKKETVARANEKIAASRKIFEAWDDHEREKRMEAASARLKGERKFLSQTRNCPSCGALGLLTGKTVHEAEARLGDGEITQEDVVLPTTFRCFTCELDLEGNGELGVADLGDQYTITWTHDPVEYFEIDIRQHSEEYEEYGND